jgi:prepilin-type N-terminal cleavage/methylation domain-containing protein
VTGSAPNPRPVRCEAAPRVGAAHPCGFTITELLFVLALMALLASLVFVSTRGVRQSAGRVETTGALRQMAAACMLYAGDHRGRILPGYLNEAELQQFNIDARLEDGRVLNACIAGGDCDASSYVWRMVPYLDHAWKTLMADYPETATVSRLAREYEDGVFGPGSAASGDLGIAVVPSIGMNSIFVGGDSVHGGAAAAPYVPWNNPDSATIAATRVSAVKNPAQLIVFGPAARANTSGVSNPDSPYLSDERLGYVELRPPFLELAGNSWLGQQWTTAGLHDVRRLTGVDYTRAGLPVCRHGADLYPVAALDGSTSVESLTELALPSNMRRWSPFAP